MGILIIVFIGGLVLLAVLLGVLSYANKPKHHHNPHDKNPDRDLEAMRYKHHKSPSNKTTRFK